MYKQIVKMLARSVNSFYLGIGQVYIQQEVHCTYKGCGIKLEKIAASTQQMDSGDSNKHLIRVKITS